jgi:hypothetical protein
MLRVDAGLAFDDVFQPIECRVLCVFDVERVGDNLVNVALEDLGVTWEAAMGNVEGRVALLELLVDGIEPKKIAKATHPRDEEAVGDFLGRIPSCAGEGYGSESSGCPEEFCGVVVLEEIVSLFDKDVMGPLDGCFYGCDVHGFYWSNYLVS